MSSIMVNDNIIDLSAKPGEKVGDQVALGRLSTELPIFISSTQ